jgi:tetratricopeptide (TPR) repeat protein
MLASFAYPIWGTPSRIKERFPVTPPLGTLDGRAYMSTGVYQTDQSPYPVVLKYDLEGIRWLNANVPGLATIVELPAEYYRAGGMRVASNTGLPMVIGGLHQDEQRADVYARLVGDRQRDIVDLLTTSDIQKALVYLSKYDVDYIYLGQLEQARAGTAGMAKFSQMASPDIGLLREVFRADSTEGGAGTIIYQVVRDNNKDPRLIVGAPVENSGIPGISITPLPTPTAVPPPTPPVDDPVLTRLMAAVAANPTDRAARLTLMEWFRDNNYPLAAAEQLEEMVKLDPTSVNLRHMLGDMYQIGGLPDKALAAWEAARDIAPNNPDAHNKVGIAYMDRRRYPDAIREFEAAVQVNPAFTESWFHLGEVQEQNGNVDAARRAYQSAIDNAREADGWSDAARARLAQLK